MKRIMKHMPDLLVAGAMTALAIGPAVGQDPTVVDAKHYKVMFENDQVRVLKITYGPKTNRSCTSIQTGSRYSSPTVR